MAKKKRNQMFKKKTASYKIDLYSMAKGQISNSDSNLAKKKKESNKNSFMLGFDPGFTKKLLKKNMTGQLFKTKKYAKVQVVLSKEDDLKKKKQPKKTIANASKKSVSKKKKNTNWE